MSIGKRTYFQELIMAEFESGNSLPDRKALAKAVARQNRWRKLRQNPSGEEQTRHHPAEDNGSKGFNWFARSSDERFEEIAKRLKEDPEFVKTMAELEAKFQAKELPGIEKQLHTDTPIFEELRQKYGIKLSDSRTRSPWKDAPSDRVKEEFDQIIKRITDGPQKE